MEIPGTYYLGPYIRDNHGNAFPALPYPRMWFYRDDLNEWYIWTGAVWIGVTTAVAAHHLTHQLGGADQVMGTVLATPNALVHRDATGRSQIVAPTVAAEIDNMGARDAAILIETNARIAADAAEAAARAAADAAHAALTAGVHGLLGACNFAAYQNVNHAVNNATVTTVQCQVEEWDIGNCYSTVNWRHTPNIAGNYLYIGNVRLQGILNGAYFNVYLYKNGVMARRGAHDLEGAVGNTQKQVVALIPMNGTTDYVVFRVYHTSGVALNTGAGIQETFFQGFLYAQN